MDAHLLEKPDTLSTLLGRISVRGNVYARPIGCGDWLISPSGHAHASFHLVSRGSCWLHMAALAQPLQLNAGDVVFFPFDVPHQLSPGREMPVGESRLPDARLGEQTQLVCGLYRSQDRELERLLRGLPDVVVARAKSNEAGLASLIAVLTEEADATEPGTHQVLNSLSDALLALLLREAIIQGHVAQGFLGGLNDPRLAPALAALHAYPGEPWNVDTLAEKAGLSRSAFAERFQRVMGTSPAAYLAEVRMQEAHALLRDNEVSVAQIAERLGYATEAAFRRAFRRVVGATPGDVRHRRSSRRASATDPAGPLEQFVEPIGDV